MKKNVFSRTLAVLASTAVLGAASMMTANAAGESVGVGSATAKPGETVSIPVIVSAGGNMDALDIAVNYDGALTAAPADAGASNVFADQNMVSLVLFDTNGGVFADGTVANISFTVPADAEVGTKYDISVGDVTTFSVRNGEDSTDVAETVETGAGDIEVVAAEEETTEAPTEAPTEAEKTTAAATTTAKATAKAAATGSPKTGTAGVAVAVAGLVTAGAAAVVLKKRH